MGPGYYSKVSHASKPLVWWWDPQTSKSYKNPL